MNTVVTTWIVTVLGQAADATAGASPTGSTEVQSIWDFIVKGGPVMIPLGLSSLVALAIILERLVSLRRTKVIPPNFLAGLRKRLGNGTDGRDDALEYCQADGSPIAMILAAGIRHLDAPRERLERDMEERGRREVLHLRKYLRGLAVIVSIAPMMGLLGTVTGMVRAFQTVATSSEALGRAELLARGIYEALITTVAGLTIAIPVLIAFHWFSAKIERLVTEIDRTAAEFIDEYAAAPAVRKGSRPRLQPLRESDESAAAEEEEGVETAAASA